jgi:2-phosphoglycerate kinase
VKQSLFKFLLKKNLAKKKYEKKEYVQDFFIASDLVQNKRSIIVLLAGPSGTGKSTLASLLGSRLGISTVLSTDTIRHIMRNFLSKEEHPILFASTYETAKYVPDPSPEEPQLKDKKKTLIGYKSQCEKVHTKLEEVIRLYSERNESLVVEGVHLTVRFMKQLCAKYPSCIPFVVYIKNEEKHKERFAVRSKQMTIDPRFNKYVANYKNIRII